MSLEVVYRKDPNLHILIMAGGSGTRFWPKSRKKKPKQLLSLWDDKTLLEHTVNRFASIAEEQNIWIVTTEDLIAPSNQILRSYKVNFLGEPSGKNTAPCILWGIKEIEQKAPNATVVIAPADPYIENEKIFIQKIEAAIIEAKSNKSIVVLGVTPSRPETGYGYIEVQTESQALQKVEKFIEKPSLDKAQEYFKAKRYYWNAGIFVVSVQTALEAFSRCMPSLSNLFSEFKNSSFDIKKIYGAITAKEAISIDYGVMEVADSNGITVSVVPVDCGWNDVGSFPALEDIGYAIKGNVVTYESESNIVQSDEGLVALLGVEDLIVVRDKDIVLVAKKDRAQDIKLLLAKVKDEFK